MKTKDFLEAVRQKLKGLPEEDIKKALDFYEEAIRDRMEDGLTEDEAVDAIGTPDEIAEQILMDTPLPKLVKAKAKPERGFRVWEIVLLILGFPLWFSLLLAAGLIVLSLIIVIAALVLTFFIVILALGLGGIVLAVASVFALVAGGGSAALLQVGIAILCMGLAVLLFIPAKALTLWIVELCGRFGKWVKLKVINSRKKGDTTNE
ncbi:Uncharacterized membrane protein [Ruminococcaceae bacterium YRB3002]|nr:Uncharacterized membrane protein [Ruminococcaceae bacterium YRB3002]